MNPTASLIVVAAVAAASVFSGLEYVGSGPAAAAPKAEPREASPAENAQKTRLRDLAGVIMASTGERVPASAPTYYVDADTFDVKARPFPGWEIPLRIRLRNVNAPEMGSRRCVKEKQLAAEAKARVKAIMDEPGVKIELTSLGYFDDYNRYLATVSVNGEDLGEMLVDEGLARVWTDKYEGQTKDYWCAASTDEAGADPRQ